MKSFGTRATAGVLLISLFYLAYRYPFQINSAVTSPTYSSTPRLLQYGKYLILLAVIATIGLGLIRGRKNRSPSGDDSLLLVWMILLFVWFFGLGVIKGAIDFISLAFAVLVGGTIAVCRQRLQIRAEPIVAILAIYALLSIVADAIQVALYVTIGRLPALGYANSTSVRFGAILDDPNGYGILCAALLPAVVLWIRPLAPRIVAALAVVVSLLLTQSLTGVGSTVVAVIVVLVVRFRPSTRVVLSVAAGGLVLGGALIAVLLRFDAVDTMIQGKRGSIEIHLRSLHAADFDLPTLFGFGYPAVGLESGYVRLLAAAGLLGVLLFLAVGIGSAIRLLQNARVGTAPERALATIGATFQIGFLVAMINLPPYEVFPLDILFFVFAALSIRPVAVTKNEIADVSSGSR